MSIGTILILALIKLIDLYNFTVFIVIIIDLLLSFNIASRSNQFIMKLYLTLRKLVDPVLEKIRKLIPIIVGPIDFSPIILFVALGIIKDILIHLL